MATTHFIMLRQNFIMQEAWNNLKKMQGCPKIEAELNKSDIIYGNIKKNVSRWATIRKVLVPLYDVWMGPWGSPDKVRTKLKTI